MSKCLLTGQETTSKTSNYPVSRDGRKLLERFKTEYNTVIRTEFVDGMVEALSNAGQPYTIEALESRAPKLSTKGVLQALVEKNETALKVLDNLGEENE